MPRRIKRAKIHTVALCKRGANRLPGIYKTEKPNQFVFETLVVKNDNILGEGLLTSVVYAPESVDSQNDIASADVIKDMAHGFFREGGKINLEHDGNPVSKDDAYPAESFVIQKGDPRFANAKDRDGNPIDVTGGWGMVIKLENKDLRQKYASGEWDGVSMEGTGEFEADTSKTEEFVDALAKRLGLNSPTEETDMDPKEIKKMIDEAIASAITALNKTDNAPEVIIDPIAKSLYPEDATKQGIAHAAIQLAKASGKTGSDLMTAAIDATVEKSTEAIEFVGSRSNPDDLRKHAEKLKAAKLEKSIDFTDADAVAKFAEEMAKTGEGDDEKEDADGLTERDKHAGIEKGDSDQVKRLKMELFKETSRSRQNGKDTDDNENSVDSGLTKKESELAKSGSRVAKWLNSQRGFGDK